MAPDSPHTVNFLFFAGGSAVHGMEIAFLALMAELNALGHRATAIVSGWNDGEYARLLEAARVDHYEVSLGRLYPSRPRWTYYTLREMPMAIRELREISARVRPDWLILTDPQLLLWSAWALPPARRALYLHSKPDVLTFRLLGRAARRHATIVLPVSDFIARCVAGTPLGNAPMAVVQNGIVLPGAPSLISTTSPVRIGIIGAIAEQKQHPVLLRAIALLKKRLSPGAFELRIVGRAVGRFHQSLDAEIASLGIGDVVVRTGFIQARDAIYDGLDIVVAPALDEAFGLTVIEAGAYGRPVVAARSGALPEIVQDQQTGLLFEPGDVDGFAAALERLILDRVLRQRLGDQARAWVGGRFTVDRMTDGFLNAIERVA